MTARSTSIAAPVGGWNARDSLADMDKMDAPNLENWFPTTTEVVLRNGYTQFATGMASQVESLLNYTGGSADKLFAFTANGKIYEVTAGGAVGAAVVTGLTNGRWETQNISTAGGNFALCVNGTDKLRGYSGTAWWTDGDGTHDITGFDTATASNITLFKNRIWFIKKNTLEAWYLPTSSIAGAAAQYSLQSIARAGGYLVDFCAWTIDAGYGVDDFIAFVTSKGEVIVYKGTDPSSIATWGLVGVWQIGSPVGSRCLMKYEGDLLVIGQDGLSPMSAALQSSRVNPKVQLTDKIQWAVSEAVTAYGGNFGWETLYYPKQNMLIMNVPVSAGSGQNQYVMNTITKSWCKFTGWAANTWCLFQNDPYFGGNGFVGKAWNTHSDNGSNITGTASQAFSYLGSPGILKRFTMIRPVISTDGSPGLSANLNIDFEINTMSAAIATTPVTGAIWDTSLWDTGIFSSGLTISKYWQGATGVGYAAGTQVIAVINGIQVKWVSTDIVFETGGIL
jgi:hypothetical protein